MTLTNDIPPPESLPESVVDDITLLPSNERLIERIDNIQKANEKSKPKLSACGKRLIDDTNQLLETTKHIVENKNNNEQIQKAFFHALRAGETQTITNRRSELKKLWSDMNEEETKQEALAGIGNVITIVRLIFTSKQFRLFFNQASTLVQETLKQKEDNTRALHATTSQNAFPEYPSIVLAQPENETTDLDQDKEEVEQELLDNWVTLLQTLHRHPEYRNSISFLRRSFSELSDYLAQQKEVVEEIAHQETRKASNNQALEHSAKAWQEAKSFIENWVGNSYSLDRLLHAVNNIIQITKSDDAIRDYFGEISKLLEHTVADPDYALNASRVETDARQLISRGRKLFHQKYDRQIAEFQKQFSYLNEAIQHDEDIQRLQEELGALFDDLLKDDKGVPTFHPELIHDLQILTPSLIGSLKSLHIPPLDFSDDDVDLKLEGAILDCSDVTPNAFKFTIRGDADGDKVSSHVDLQISKIRARIHDVKFYYRKKTGFPKYEDSGVADLMIHGNEGMTIDLSLVSNFETTGDHVDSIFTIEQCQCKISKLNLHLHKTSHDVLYTMMAPLMNMTIKSRIERYIENSITTIVKRGDKYLKTAVNDGRQAVENATERINEKVDKKINVLLGGNSNPNNQIVNNKDDTPVIIGTNIASDDSINNRSLHTVI